MNHSNYTVFEILKYKIDFLECLEYSMPSYTINKDEIAKKLSPLKKDFKDGLYKEIVSSLFTSFNKLNKPIRQFFKKYNENKLENIHNSKKIKELLKYNEIVINCYETFNYILNAFLEEDQIVKTLDNKLLELIKINNDYFENFLFFNCYTLYLEFNHNDWKYTDKEISRTIKLLNYCNKDSKFIKQMETLEENNQEKIYKELETISNICTKLHEHQINSLKEFIALIEKEIHK